MRPALSKPREWYEYKRWITLLLIISSIYIVAELAYNAMLLNASSGLVRDIEEFERVEIVGRLLASFGCALFVLGFIPLNRKDRGQEFTCRRALGVLGVTTLIVGPLFYVGSNAWINQYIVEPSSGQDRWNANIADFLKRGESSGIFSTTGMLLGKHDDPTSADRMTFQAIYPAVMLNSESALRRFHNRELEKHLSVYIKVQAAASWREGYATYKKHEPDMKEAWLGYRRASNQFNTLATGIDDRSFNKVWNQVRDELRSNWPRADKSISAARKKEVRNTDFIAETWYEQYVSYRKGRRGRHISRLETEGLPGVQRYMRKDLQHINYFAEVCGGKGKIGRTCFPSERDFFNYFWNAFSKSDKIDKRSGYPITVKTYSDFLNHEKTGEAVRRQLNKKLSIYLPTSFDKAFRGNPTTTRRYINQAFRKSALGPWRVAVAQEMGLSARDIRRLEPNLTNFTQFVRHPDIERLIRAETGGMYSPDLRLGMSPKQYTREVFYDIVNETNEELMEKFKRSSISFHNGRKYADEGKEVYRAVVVPPIVLGLSLFFSLVAFVKMPLMINELLFANSKGRRDRRNIANGILVAGVLAILILPLMADVGKMNRGMIVTYNMLVQQERPWTARAVHWIYAMEPIMYNVGQTVLMLTMLDNREIVTIHNANYDALY